VVLKVKRAPGTLTLKEPLVTFAIDIRSQMNGKTLESQMCPWDVSFERTRGDICGRYSVSNEWQSHQALHLPTCLRVYGFKHVEECVIDLSIVFAFKKDQQHANPEKTVCYLPVRQRSI